MMVKWLLRDVFNQLPMEFPRSRQAARPQTRRFRRLNAPHLGSPALIPSFSVAAQAAGLSRSSSPFPRDQSRRRPAALRSLDLHAARGRNQPILKGVN